MKYVSSSDAPWLGGGEVEGYDEVGVEEEGLVEEDGGSLGGLAASLQVSSP